MPLSSFHRVRRAMPLRHRRLVPCVLACLALTVLAARAGEPPAATGPRLANLRFDGERWSYVAEGRTIAGYLLRPAGNGPFPAVIINHGKGGRPEDLSLRWAREMVNWGLVCVCTTLTHVAGTEIQGQDGASAENLARLGDAVALLARAGNVDLQRVAVIGHSMGAFATIGFCGTQPAAIKAAVICAGGVTTRPGMPMPHVDVAARITAATLILHGTVDGAVAPPTSAQLQALLERSRVPHRRVLFEGTNHDLPTNPATRATVVALIREWLATAGVLDAAGNTAPTLTPPADHTARVGQPFPALAFTVGDRESAAADLIVTAATSYPRLLPAENLTLGGAGAERVLQWRPLPGQAGRTTVFLTVSDGRLVTTRSFVLSVADATGAVPPPIVERPGPGRRGPPPPR